VTIRELILGLLDLVHEEGVSRDAEVSVIDIDAENVVDVYIPITEVAAVSKDRVILRGGS